MIIVLLVISILFQLQPAVSVRGEGQRGRGARQVSGTVGHLDTCHKLKLSIYNI